MILILTYSFELTKFEPRLKLIQLQKPGLPYERNSFKNYTKVDNKLEKASYMRICV